MLIASIRNKLLVAILIFVILVSSIITSARTGLAAFFIYLAMFGAWGFVTALAKGRISLKLIFLPFSMILVVFAFFYIMPALTGRAVDLSTSGRFNDFALGFGFFLDHPAFGALLDYGNYFLVVSSIPHNIFIYALFMGGVVLYFLFCPFSRLPCV